MGSNSLTRPGLGSGFLKSGMTSTGGSGWCDLRVQRSSRCCIASTPSGPRIGTMRGARLGSPRWSTQTGATPTARRQLGRKLWTATFQAQTGSANWGQPLSKPTARQLGTATFQANWGHFPGKPGRPPTGDNWGQPLSPTGDRQLGLATFRASLGGRQMGTPTGDTNWGQPLSK